MKKNVKSAIGLLNGHPEDLVRFSVSASVSVPAGMMDKLDGALSYSSYDNGHMVVCSDEISEWMACEDDEDRELYELLKQVDKEVPLGMDITFSLD